MSLDNVISFMPLVNTTYTTNNEASDQRFSRSQSNMAKTKKKRQNNSGTTSTEVATSSTDGNSQSERLDVDGFRVIQWKVKKESSVIHHFFAKIHKNIEEEINSKKPSGKTLLIINIPSFITQENIQDLFSEFGKIVNVFVHQNPTSAIPEPDDPYFPQYKNQIYGFKVAYVVFSHPKSVLEVLRTTAPLVLENRTQIVTGLRKWIREYNSSIIEPPVLEAEVKKFMENFDKQELRRKREENGEGEPDDEGWIKVGRTGARAGTRRTEQTEAKLKEKKRRSEKKVMTLTPGQMKETKAKQLADLKRKFEEDKERVSHMKQQRKFKPFVS